LNLYLWTHFINQKEPRVVKSNQTVMKKVEIELEILSRCFVKNKKKKS